MNIYDFSVKTQKGDNISLSQYKGKVLLIVNTATGCGFTTQYSELQDLYEKFNEKGFEILDFPCNQFGNQAPGNNEEIHTFCTGRFGITFPQFAKIDVNGEQAIPLYKWLTENSSFKGFGHSPIGLMLSGTVKLTDKNYKKNNNIKWNFTKFLIDRNGNIVERFEPTDMKHLEEKIGLLI
ncbi:MAG: glutathione peroxidase [Treponema sp.]|nr:glutathione peroxidase [Treponema sp.]